MGLFKSKKSSGAPPQDGAENSIPTTAAAGDKNKSKSKKKFPFLKQKKKTVDNQEADKQNQEAAVVATQQRDSHKDIHDHEEDADLGDIPRSISTPSRDNGGLLPPATPNSNTAKDKDEDSIGSPCERMLKSQQAQQQASSNAAKTEEDAAEEAKRAQIISNLTAILTSASNKPTLDHLHYYIQALSPTISNPSGDLPARALRCLFSLSEHSGDKAQRIEMVNGVVASKNEEKNEDETKDSPKLLVPTLLSFLQRCSRDTSEQYLTLLVLNNLSIPTANKRPIALEYGGAKTLGKLLCEDPGCHLLVIILVNLTFGDEGLNRDLLCFSESSVRQRSGVSLNNVDGKDESKNEGGEAKKFLSCGGDVQLVDSLGYALLLASLTTTQLNRLGPIPLTSPEGIPYTPRKLLSTLFGLIETKLGIRYRKGGDSSVKFTRVSLDTEYNEHGGETGDGGDDCPFPETARWCLGALKNLTRPSKLSQNTSSSEEEVSKSVQLEDASSVASQAILDAGLLPILLRILRNKESSSSALYYNWTSNSSEDAALYTLMHMTSAPTVRDELLQYSDCAYVLVGILNYGKVIGKRLLKNVTGGDEEGNGEQDEEIKNEDDAELGLVGLQCLKARIALSNLLLSKTTNDNSSSVKSKYGTATTLAEYEIHSFIELLSNTLYGRAKEGSKGGYSAATFALKDVSRVMKSLLSEPKNRELFATTTSSSGNNGCRLNSLLLKVVARYSLLSMNNEESSSSLSKVIVDAEAAEHALTSLCFMTLYGMDEDKIGFSNPLLICTTSTKNDEEEKRQEQMIDSSFLPATFGDYGKMEGKSVLTKVLMAYLDKTKKNAGKKSITSVGGRYAASQILVRVGYLKFVGSVQDLTYKKKASPSKTDFDIDAKLLTILKNVVTNGREEMPKGEKPKEYIFNRAVIRKAKEENAGVAFSSALVASERLICNQSFLSGSSKRPIDDAISIANNIAYYADGLDMYLGYTWKWEDGKGDLIERMYSAAETEDQLMMVHHPNEEDEAKEGDSMERSEPYSPPRKGFLGRLPLKFPITVVADENEPLSIFGLRCTAPMCGKGYLDL